jgi:FtsX-like permease family
MPGTTQASTSANWRTFAAASLFLARWQIQQAWRLLIVTGVGLVAAVILVCAASLSSQITMTAELRDFLRANGSVTGSAISNSEIDINSVARQVSPAAIASIRQQLDTELMSNLGPYLNGPGEFSIQLNGLPYLQPEHDGRGRPILKDGGNTLNLIGAAMPTAVSRVNLLAGRLPQRFSAAYEVAVGRDFARAADIVPGSIITAQISFVSPGGIRIGAYRLSLRVAGIFTIRPDRFWHNQDFSCEASGLSTVRCPLLISNDTLMAGLGSYANNPALAGSAIEQAATPLWYYRIDPERVDAANLPDFARGLASTLADIANKPVEPPFVVRTTAFSPAPGALNTYNSHVAVVQIPVTSLLLLVVGMTLFFVSMMSAILVDRQAEAIAILRSRGASRAQVFISLMLQGIALALCALLVGPLIAIPIVRMAAAAELAAVDQSALNIISNDALLVLRSLYLAALLTVGIAIPAMLLAIYGAMRQDVLSLRRAQARSTHRPIWQRFSLDVVAAIIALTGYAFSAYESGPGVLDARVRALVLPPLTLTGVIFLLLGLALLFLRLFPSILRLAAALAALGRSASPTLALAQMARAPRQSLRMTMLLAFAIAFAIFTLIFNASQAQRINDVADFEVGADFSGKIPDNVSNVQSSAYGHIPGVISASVGYTSEPRAAQNGQDLSARLMAVDAGTFAQTAIWTGRDALQPATSLMHTLLDQRARAGASGVVPAIVDATAWNSLHLSPGSIFTINDFNGSISCITVARVERIPTINDSSLAASDSASAGGILVDYQSYSAAMQKSANSMPPMTNVWLRTRSDDASLSRVRAALSRGDLQLEQVNDRRTLIANSRADPLYLGLAGLLLIGAAASMLLAILGNLLASWLNVRSRLTSFAVLRALGITPRQVVGIIAWEQSIVYATALAMGGAFGALLSAMALPALVFTNVTLNGFNSDISSGEYDVLQSSPPVRVIVPPSLIILCALVVAICLVALALMVRVAARPSISQTLRLNED